MDILTVLALIHEVEKKSSSFSCAEQHINALQEQVKILRSFIHNKLSVNSIFARCNALRIFTPYLKRTNLSQHGQNDYDDVLVIIIIHEYITFLAFCILYLYFTCQLNLFPCGLMSLQHFVFHATEISVSKSSVIHRSYHTCDRRLFKLIRFSFYIMVST